MGSLASNVSSLIGHGDEFSNNRRNIILANFNANTITNLVTGNFLTGFLLCLGASDKTLGLFFSLNLLGNLLQVFSPLFMERLESRKHILLLLKAVQYVLIILIMGLVPFLTAKQQVRMVILTVSFSCAGVLSALTIPGFSVWHIRSIPTEQRTFYFAFFNTANGLVTYTLLIFAGLFVDWMSKTSELSALLCLRILAALCAVVELTLLSRVREYTYPAERERKPQFRMLLSPLRSRPYRLTLALASVWMFVSNLPGPYLTVYLLGPLGVGYSFINIVGVANLIILLVASPFWVRRIRRHDSQSVLAGCAAVMAFSYTGMVFLQRQALWLYPLFMVFNFIATTGVGIVMSNLPFLYLSPENQTGCVGLFSSAITLFAITGVQAGTAFATHTAGTLLQIGAISLTYHQQLFLLTAAALWVSAYVIRRLARSIHKLTQEAENSWISEPATGP